MFWLLNFSEERKSQLTHFGEHLFWEPPSMMQPCELECSVAG